MVNFGVACKMYVLSIEGGPSFEGKKVLEFCRQQKPNIWVHSSLIGSNFACTVWQCQTAVGIC